MVWPRFRVLNMVRISRFKPDTMEQFRADLYTLRQVPASVWPCFNDWENQVQLRGTWHVQQRLSSYVNQWNKNHTAIELYPEEFQWLQKQDLTHFLPKYAQWTNRAILVELGWNAGNEICKAAYVLPVPQSVYTRPGRCLFFCVGMDGGVKTLYITSTFKHRSDYQGTVPYLNKDQLLQKLIAPWRK